MVSPSPHTSIGTGLHLFLMKQQFLITHHYKVFIGDRKNLTSPPQVNLSMLCFYGNIRSSNFLYVHNILTEGVFVTQLSHNLGF